MKLSQQQKSTGPAVEAIMQLIDAEMAKIVADIDAHRPLRPTGKPRAGRTKVQHAKAA